jgi:DNA-directed RNA polymerase specialized sigma24 family protein
MSQAMPTLPTSRSHTDSLGDPALRRAVEKFVRRRVPPSDVEDVVQTVFVDALAAEGRPEDPGELARWLLGIARHKVVDRHRRATREPAMELPEIAITPAPMEARALARWAEEQAGDKGDAQKTLDWMAREGEGEKLDAIAAEERIPAARVRQRVSRMRRWMKERWAAELAAVAMLAALALAAWWLLHGKEAPPEAHDQPGTPPTITPELNGPMDRARALRADALRACDRSAWRECLDGLDRAKELDPAGDQAPEVGAARQNAAAGLRDEAPSPKAPPVPTTTMKSAPVPTSSTTSTVPTDTTDEKGDKLEKKPSPKKSKAAPPSVKPSDMSDSPGTPAFSGSAKGMKKRASATVLDPSWSK